MSFVNYCILRLCSFQDYSIALHSLAGRDPGCGSIYGRGAESHGCGRAHRGPPLGCLRCDGWTLGGQQHPSSCGRGFRLNIFTQCPAQWETRTRMRSLGKFHDRRRPANLQTPTSHLKPSTFFSPQHLSVDPALLIPFPQHRDFGFPAGP
jgi:hypothetical protein